MSNFDQLYMCILNLHHIKPEVSMVWQMYIFCHHNTCSFHFCGTKLMYVYGIKRVPRLHQRAPNGTQIFKISRGRPPGPPPMGGGHPLPYPPPVSAAPTQKEQAPSSVSQLNGYLNWLNFFLATSLIIARKKLDKEGKRYPILKTLAKSWTKSAVTTLLPRILNNLKF